MAGAAVGRGALTRGDSKPSGTAAVLHLPGLSNQLMAFQPYPSASPAKLVLAGVLLHQIVVRVLEPSGFNGAATAVAIPGDAS